jgi:TRAP-type mannitol/chloroaromatic compound transport system substrate-binding protein
MKLIGKNALLFVVMLAIIATGITNAYAQSGSGKVFKWDITYPLYRGTWDWKVLEKWCADVKKASGDRLILTPMAGGEIMPVMETFDAVSTGTLKIDFSYGPYWIGKTPMAIYASGLPPFTLPSVENYWVLYNELGLKDIIRKAYAKHNIFYVGFVPSNNAVLLSKTPVKSASDFKGKKLRATGVYAEVITQAGAAAVFFPWGEIYGALEKGVIDGVIAGPLSSQADSGFHEPTKFLLETPITSVDGWSLEVNMDAWKALPEDLQQILIQSTSYASELFTSSYYAHDMAYREKIANKFSFTTFSEKDQLEMRKHSLAVLEKYSAKDPDFAEATKILKKYMNDLGLMK